MTLYRKGAGQNEDTGQKIESNDYSNSSVATFSYESSAVPTSDASVLRAPILTEIIFIDTEALEEEIEDKIIETILQDHASAWKRLADS